MDTSTKVIRPPWEAFGPANTDPINNQVLELYDLTKDLASQDVAEQYPEKLKEMKQIVSRGNPEIQGVSIGRFGSGPPGGSTPNITAGRTEFVYTHPMASMPQGDFPSILNSSYRISADITVPRVAQRG